MNINYKPGDDLKVKIRLRLDGADVDPLSVPFDVRLWTNSKATAVKAGWDGESFYGGCSVAGGAVQVVADSNPKWWEGVLHGEAVLHYPDSEMPDKSFDRLAEIVFEGYDAGEIVGTVDHVVYGLSAYDLAVRQGYVGTLQEWLASLHGKAGADAAIVSETYDADGNSIITWADGKTTVVKRGRKGDDGYTPIKGVDYFDGKDGADGGILFPSTGIDEEGNLYIEVPNDEESTNLVIDEEGFLCVKMPDLR